MSYQVLARKWRPKNFHEMVGQEHVLRALINALDNQRLHHAYLFTGTRGVGKTTIARIFAKSLNCENGVSAEPCGVCRACTEIDEGRFVDLIEVDAASRTKVEDTRELLENVQYAPTQGRYKVYLIDEVHMLSGHSFNALLKTLEEPPPHVKFLLATTDPQKLPITILSRCLQFSLKRLSRERISEHLQNILNAEGLQAEPGALALLARAADGSMRDALSLMDQAIAYGSGQLLENEVSTMLGTIDRGQVFGLLQALLAGDGLALLQAVDELAQQAPDFAAVLAELISVLHHVAVAQSVPGALSDEVEQRQQIEQLAGQMTPEDIQLYYQIALVGRRDLPLAPDARSGFEMIMLRMLAFKPEAMDAPAGGGNGPSGNQVQASGREALRAAVGKAPVSAQQAADAQPAAVKPAGVEQVPQPAMAAPQAQPVQQAAPVAPKPEAIAVPQAAVPQADAPAPMPTAPTPTPTQNAQAPVLDMGELAPASEADINTPLFGEQQRTIPADPQGWASLIETLPLTAMTRQLALNCVVGQVDESSVQLSLNQSHQHVLNDRHIDKLSEVLSSYTGKPVRVQVNLVAELEATPVQLENERQAQRQQAAETEIHNDPNVRAMMETFDAQIQNGSIRPQD